MFDLPGRRSLSTSRSKEAIPGGQVSKQLDLLARWLRSTNILPKLMADNLLYHVTVMVSHSSPLYSPGPRTLPPHRSRHPRLLAVLLAEPAPQF